MFQRSQWSVLCVILVYFLYCISSGFANETTPATKKNSSKFIVITPEKCGTFLLSKALNIITGKGYVHYYPRKVEDLNDFLHFVKDAHNNNKFVFCHVSPDKTVVEGLKNAGYKVFFILRDPRDQLISGMFMIRDGHPLAGIPPLEFEKLSEDDQITELITGELFEKPIFEVSYARQLPWLKESRKFIHVSRFEELVGSKGGGDDAQQIKAVKSLGKHLGIKMSTDRAKKTGQALFGNTWSFRNGQIGSFQHYFTEDHKILYKAKYSQTLIDLKYEENVDW